MEGQSLRSEANAFSLFVQVYLYVSLVFWCLSWIMFFMKVSHFVWKTPFSLFCLRQTVGQPSVMGGLVGPSQKHLEMKVQSGNHGHILSWQHEF